MIKGKGHSRSIFYQPDPTDCRLFLPFETLYTGLLGLTASCEKHMEFALAVQEAITRLAITCSNDNGYQLKVSM